MTADRARAVVAAYVATRPRDFPLTPADYTLADQLADAFTSQRKVALAALLAASRGTA